MEMKEENNRKNRITTARELRVLSLCWRVIDLEDKKTKKNKKSTLGLSLLLATTKSIQVMREFKKAEKKKSSLCDDRICGLFLSPAAG